VSIGKARLGGVPVRTYTPDEIRTDARLLWIHGGGMVIGAPPMDDLLLTETARRLGMIVTSVDYRLAPEHPFPAPLDDCFAVWQQMAATEGALGRVAIGGQSAGGGLAASLVQRVHDLGELQPIAQWLFCPMLDDRTAADRDRDVEGQFVWNNTSNRAGWGALLGAEPGSIIPPPYAVAARRSDLRGLPPTWIGVGDIDLFHNEYLAYAKRLTESGVDVTTVVVPRAPHGFESLAPRAQLAMTFRTSAQKWLQRRVQR
jgi:acetyl esterase/lipase